MEEQARVLPLPFRGAGGYAEQVGDFLELQAGKESELHYADLARAEPGEVVESRIERQNIDAQCGRRRRVSYRQAPLKARSAFCGGFLPDVVDEDLAHGPSRQRQEVLSVDKAQARVLSQFQVRLVNKSGCAQRLAGPTARELYARETAQVLIRDSEQLVRRIGVALAPAVEELFDVGGHWSSISHTSRALRSMDACMTSIVGQPDR
jgi:hypothetical protein